MTNSSNSVYAPLITTLGPGADSLEDIMLRLGNTDLTAQQIKTELSRLINLLKDLSVSLKATFCNAILVSHMPQYFDWIQDGRTLFYPLYRCFSNVEPMMLKLLDILERIQDEKVDKDLVKIFDCIDEVSNLVENLAPAFQSIKNLFDTALEFNEIFKDHMNSLTEEIESNLRKCLDLQKECFASPVRHPPCFTLDQLIPLISLSSNNQRIQMPTFSELERQIYEDYCRLYDTIEPIETSLKEILKGRIEVFKNRDIINLDYLMRLLNHKYNNILEKYDYFYAQLMNLKANIIDKRWDVLFKNLNAELLSIITDVTDLLDDLSNTSISVDTRDIILQQVAQKSETISKTFDVIYQAIDASILNSTVAEVTNDLADKWLALKDKVDPILPKKSDSDPIEVLTKRMSDMSISEDNSDGTHKTLHFDRSKRRSVGALLLKKMNIKPILTSSDDDEKSVFNTVHKRKSSQAQELQSKTQNLESKNPAPKDNESTMTSTNRKDSIELESAKIIPSIHSSVPTDDFRIKDEQTQDGKKRTLSPRKVRPRSTSANGPSITPVIDTQLLIDIAEILQSPSRSVLEVDQEYAQSEESIATTTQHSATTVENSNTTSPSTVDFHGDTKFKPTTFLPQTNLSTSTSAIGPSYNGENLGPKNENYIEQVEQEKFKYYASRNSRIPMIYTNINVTNTHNLASLTHLQFSNKATYDHGYFKLKAPTPLSDLFHSTKMQRI
ncbi:Kar9p Ecym_3006 [Eremothecium cymbalariae DBVPG|uniref:Karyogamy protein KAR9 n=1 Tax=Eremothecium cymbalariae (strain CBS 270.75 / DBVPG 7215 / KCTC 17166 / NRRL Y-17582) TaxID=931890 RepID=G8JQV6_ERECY|nr:Hypothetical protein Ecym_3006 [Eremothecium cymbalariae DBVPG\